VCAYDPNLQNSDEVGTHYHVFSSLGGTEAIVAGLWKVVLDLPHLELDDNLFEIGVPSLRALELLSRINQTFERELPEATIFDYPTVRAMARLLHGTGQEGGSAQSGGQSIKP
jgi:acyl carrier protein